MRRLFTLIFVLLTVVAFASPVSKGDAERVAVNHYRHYAPSSITDFSVSAVSETRQNGVLTYYTFAFKSGGFVMVAADDAIVPILGSSYQGNFSVESVSPQAQAWYDSYSNQILAIVNSNISNAATRPEWERLMENRFEKSVLDVNPLLTTTWDQGCYYNTLCPVANAGMGSCNHAWTGCVATTMAQIMKYHSFPVNGLNSHSYTHATYGLQSANFATANFNFSAMPNNVTSNNADVARLMYYAGVAVNMGYGTDGSGAYSIDVPFAMVNFFNYDPTIGYAEMVNYTATDWKNLLIAELTANRPVYYSGSSTASGGHAWVCDGYRSSDSKFHFNWGWSGSGNGYYAIGSLNPLGNNFNDDNAIVYNIKPGANQFSWVIQNSAFTTASRGIEFVCAVDANTAWASAYDGTNPSGACAEFTVTTDGGQTWTPKVMSNGTGLKSAMVYAVNGSKAWAPMFKVSGNNPQGIYYTSNGGTTWAKQTTALFTNASSFPNCVYFFDENNGWCMGDPINGDFEIYTTSNGGTTWTVVPGANIPAPVSGEFGVVGYYSAVNNTVWFGTNKARVYKSTDKGLTWNVYTVGAFASAAYVKTAFKDEMNGIAMDLGGTSSTTNGKLAETSDGGATWTLINSTGPVLTNDIDYVPGTDNTYVRTGADTEGDYGMAYSFDGGHNWTYFGGTSSKQCLAGGFVDNTCGWVGAFNENQYNNGMYKMTGLLGTGSSVAQITVNASALSALLTCIEEETLVLGISNTGTADLTWTASIDPVTATWATLPVTAGTTPAGQTTNLDVHVSAIGMEPGVYEANLVLNNNSINSPVLNVPITMTVQSGVGIVNLANQVKVYPNPSTGILNIVAGTNISNVSILNMAGQVVYSQDMNADQTRFNLPAGEKGLYLVKVTTAQGVSVQKIEVR